MDERRPTWGVLILAGVVALLSARLAVAGTSGELIEMEVLGVVPLEAETASLLILRQKGARTVLPIFVGRHEGAGIEQRLKQPAARRSQPTDLLARTIDVLGARVSQVAIDGAQAALFSARVTLQQGDRRIEMDARPSDSVALAIASHAPIFATRHVVSEAGLTEDDLSRGHPGGRRQRGRRAEEDPAGAGPEQSF
jgi:bifunctional DNase/RNase